MCFDQLINISSFIRMLYIQSSIIEKSKQSYLKLTTFYLFIKIWQQTYF